MSFAYVILPLIVIAVIVIEIMEKSGKNRFAILGASFIIGLTVFSFAFMQSRRAETNLRVVGYANKLFDSDTVKWNINLSKRATFDEVNQAYSQMNSDTQAFKEFLITKGVKTEDINLQPITITPVYEQYGLLTAYNIVQAIYVLSSDLAKIEEISLNPEFFGKRNIIIDQSNLTYYYSKLPELKKQLLAEATADAVSRAEEITHASKAKLGKMKDARAGVFQITEPYSTEVSDWGIYSTNTKKKSISVTLTANFGLK
ncbi:MAG: SIMPL domain-containing protein [Candidatus Cloacimonetes bacterium]|nr:SIMPL domain-containing protein [Candidatus Cloacimonadota bacterium]